MILPLALIALLQSPTTTPSTGVAPSTAPATQPAQPAHALPSARPWHDAGIDAGRIEDVFTCADFEYLRTARKPDTDPADLLRFNVIAKRNATVPVLEARFYDAEDRLLDSAIVRFEPLVVQFKSGDRARAIIDLTLVPMWKVRRIELLPI
jgi:hypothetical protein